MAQKKQIQKSNGTFMKKNDSSQISSKKQSVFFTTPIFVLLGFTILLYANSLFNKYALDDSLMIVDNKFTQKGFKGIDDILTNDSFVGFFGKQKKLVAGGRYRPLSHITFAVEKEFFGFNPFVGHLINILLYAFSCGLIYLILKMLFNTVKKQWYLTIPFIATAFFIAHPIHTEAVTNIKGRDEILSMLGSFGALYFILKYVENSCIIELFWASLVFFLALMSKENAITFIVVIPLTLYFFTKFPIKKTIISVGCLMFVSLIFIYIRYRVLGYLMDTEIEYELLNNPFIEANVIQKYATIFYTWGKYLILLIFPYQLTHDYYPKQIPIIEMSDLRAIIPIIIYLLLIVYALWKFKKKDIISYGIFFFLVTFSISSNLVFPIGAFMNERFLFVPLLGFCIILAYIFTEKWFKENFALSAIVVIILFAYSVRTIARNPVWKDDYTLFTTDVKVSSNSAKCNVSAGGKTVEKAEVETDSLKKIKLLNDALIYLKKGVTIHPKYVAGWMLLGKAMIDFEDYKKSREYYETALKISRGHKDAINNLLYCAQMCAKKGNFDEALIGYSNLIGYQPENADLYVQLAEVYENKNKIDSTLKILERLLKKNPRHVRALAKTGEVYGKYLNKIDKSFEYLLQAYSLSPTDAAILEDLGVIYGIKKDYDKSIEFFKKAIAQRPDNSQLYTNLAYSYLNKGDKQKMNECMAKAAELQKKKK